MANTAATRQLDCELVAGIKSLNPILTERDVRKEVADLIHVSGREIDRIECHDAGLFKWSWLWAWRISAD